MTHTHTNRESTLNSYVLIALALIIAGSASAYEISKHVLVWGG